MEHIFVNRRAASELQNNRISRVMNSRKRKGRIEDLDQLLVLLEKKLFYTREEDKQEKKRVSKASKRRTRLSVPTQVAPESPVSLFRQAKQNMDYIQGLPKFPSSAPRRKTKRRMWNECYQRAPVEFLVKGCPSPISTKIKS